MKRKFALAAGLALLQSAGSAVSATPAWDQSNLALSQRPTFACERAQTSIARIICLEPSGPTRDWELSAASWALRFSLEEASRDTFLQQHRQWFQSLYAGCGLSADQTTWWPWQAGCVLNAFQGRARFYRAQLSGDPLIESQMLPEQRAEIQFALIRLNFLDHEADGEFGPLTRQAIRRFQESGGFPQGDFLTERQRSALLTQAFARQNPPSPNAPEKNAEQTAKFGTGFFVSEDGHILTNAHVVGGCESAKIVADNEEAVTGNVAARDLKNDLALIKTGLRARKHAFLRVNIRQGEPVAAFGYPLAGYLPRSGNFTLGNISAMAGLHDDTRYIQISTPVQTGNSGGPLLDYSGKVVGVVTGKLDAVKMAQVLGDLAQNVNFAIKSEIAASFLASNRVPYSAGFLGNRMELADLADHARALSVFIGCVPPVSAREY